MAIGSPLANPANPEAHERDGRTAGGELSMKNGQGVRFAVVGLGHFAQTAILPAFKTASHSRLTALFSNDETKLNELARKYSVGHASGYFADCIESDKAPEPSGQEGLADLLVIEVIHESMRTGVAVKVNAIGAKPGPSVAQQGNEPAHSKPPTIHAQPPSQ
jgi:hypothetical protein